MQENQDLSFHIYMYNQDQSTTTFAAAGWPPLVDPIGHGPVIHERREQAKAK